MSGPVEILERALVSKTGRPEDCEDLVYMGRDFAAVIDGATRKTDALWDGETRGRYAARVLAATLDRVPAKADAREAVDRLTAATLDAYRRFGVEDVARETPGERLTASIAVFSRHAREVWLVGDCQALVGKHTIETGKAIDVLLAGARAAFLEIALADGATIRDLRETDPGREFIRPLLQSQAILQNNLSAGPLWYPVIDGFPVPGEGMRIFPVPDHVTSVVLATDGYPFLRATLAESEAELERVLERDPLCIRHYRSTKCTRPGDVSFDDRAFLSVRT